MWRLKGLGLLEKCRLMLLKVIAILGYYHGKTEWLHLCASAANKVRSSHAAFTIIL